MQFVAKSTVTSPIVLFILVDFFLVCWTPNKEKVKPISTVQKLFQPCRRDSWCVRFSLSSAASRDRTDVHHIANTFICCVLQQSAPVETGENLLIITMSTVHSYEEATRHSGNNKLVCRRLGLLSVCSPSKSWRRRHSTSTGQAECVHLLCSLCVRLSSGSKLTVRGQGGSQCILNESPAVHILREVTTWTPL